MRNWLNNLGPRPSRLWRLWGLVGVGILFTLLVSLVGLSPTQAQSGDAVEQQEDAVIQRHRLPQSTPQAPVVRPQPRPRPSPQPVAPAPRPSPSPATIPAPTTPAPATPAPASPQSEPAVAASPEPDPLSEYVLQFNRAPVVGNALQMQGVLSQARLGFTRPRHWQVESAQVLVRFRHSPALYGDRSNLTVRLNNRHLGSVPLNREDGEIGNVLFDVPTDLIEDFNTLIMVVQQHTSDTCTDPTDPTLWTEILPDSQVAIRYRPQPMTLDFASYPYPFLDPLGLEADRLTYLRPKTVDSVWLTASSRYQAVASRLTNSRPLETQLVSQIDQAKAGDSLVVIGTPAEQPLLADLELPFTIQNQQVLDGGGNPLPNTVGVLMLTTTVNGEVPVLVATGNAPEAVLKAVQALTQTGDRQLLTGQAALVNEVAEVDSPDPRDWPGYLPQDRRRLRLSDLKGTNGQPFQDVTVNGLPIPPAVDIPFKTLPDEHLQRGSTFTLRYSYGPGIDPKRSSVSVLLNGEGIGGKRLRLADGGTDAITIDIPPDLVTSDAKLAVQFYMFPDTPIACGELPDQPTWGTVHSNSSFHLNRISQVQMPDLKLLQTGFPLTAPQDLSAVSMVLPDSPSDEDIVTLLTASGRLGRLSQGPAVKLQAYGARDLPNEARQGHVVAIGLQDDFPLSEALQSVSGFSLGDQFSRQHSQTQLQTLPDSAGMIMATVSPWRQDRLLLGLTAQTPTGLREVQAALRQDGLFSRLAGDTAIIQRTTPNPSIYNQADYQVTTLAQQSPRTIHRSGLGARVITFLQANWFLVPGSIVLLALLLYSLSQLFLNRLSQSEGI
ncbi:MAG: cellulose biosynthesis cyclic di-GMP-binding regulatory protein BcsB [Leptolyngbya sp. LCM1.Bin17]|nr:MAG: cellulose biosynthesis cyclic di-GMP-binding regulatory protein BcsB [Leptolyngbya sp. LCM1.Bin17]